MSCSSAWHGIRKPDLHYFVSPCHTYPDNAIASRDERVFDPGNTGQWHGTASPTVPLAVAFAPTDDLSSALIAVVERAPGNDIDQQSLLDLQSRERGITSPARADFDEALAEEGLKLFHGPAPAKTDLLE